MGYTLKAMPDARVREISCGEVSNFGRYNFKYKYPKPHVDGLFCQKIFGPIRDYTCDCNITKKSSVTKNFKGEKCPTCKVEYLPVTARGHRFGHIELNTWYVNPVYYNLVGNILGIGERMLKSLSEGEIKASLMATSNGRLLAADGTPYTIMMDPENGDISCIHDLVMKMKEIEIDGDISMMENISGPGKAYFKAGFSLYDFFNSTILVTPPIERDIRNIGDRIGYGEVNVLFTRLMRESLRVIAIEQEPSLSASDKKEMLKFEALMVQKLVNMLYIDGAEYGKVAIDGVMEKLKGKEGLLRSNLLGKRIDFSGRSVITSGPHLPIDSVGIPHKMVHELFKPHLIRMLMDCINDDVGMAMSAVSVMKMALKEHSKMTERVLMLIEEVAADNVLLMNRAPSLHRYSVMTFNIHVHYGKCIYFPPLACTPFNADNDGDTLGVYALVSKQAQVEAAKLISFTNNLMSSANFGKPNAAPSHEMVVGSYLLSNSIGV